jgi:hypothetical protein
MSRQQKRGVDYFPFDVDFFADRKIKELRGKYGADGVTLYLYLLCQIYKDEGYYLAIDDGFDYVMSADLGMDSNKTGQILNFLCKRALFDDELFTSDKILTSHGIQMRFQEIVKVRGLKKEIAVNEKYWLLKNDEVKSYIKVTHFSDNSKIKGDKSEIKDHFSVEERHKVKESKVKESKVNKSKDNIGTDKPSRTRFVKPTVKEIASYCQERGNNINAEHFFDYYESKGWTVGKQPMKDWKAAVRNWERNGYSATCSKNEQVGKGNYDHRQYDDALLDSFVNRGIEE